MTETTAYAHFLSDARYVASRNKLTLAAGVILLAFVVLAIVGPLVAPYDPLATNSALTLTRPSLAHPFGADALGRDILSRVIVAARLDLGMALGAVAISFAGGTLLGAVAGYAGGWADALVGRVMDTIMAFPLFVLAMGIVAALGNSVLNIVLATAIINLPFYARFARAEINVRRELAYVEAARMGGNGSARILVVHLIPNILPTMAVQASLNLGWAILNAAGLSFIGLGVRPPTPEWGIMVSEGASYIFTGEWWTFACPGFALVLAVFCFNLIGDGLRDLMESEGAHMSVPLLSVEGLSLEFTTRAGRVQALEDVSFAIDKGEIVGIVGESGSGKSVLSYAIMGLLDAAARIPSGSIHFEGQDLRTAGDGMADLRGRELSMIFQSPRTSLNPIRRVGRQIEDVLVRHGPAPRSKARRAAIAALGRVRIPDPERRYEAYPFELSGGMCQRVMIAMALACEPALLIADEPTTGLDVTTQAVVMDLIREIVAETRMAAILITHDLALAGEYCDRILVMHAGHIVEAAPTASFPGGLRHPYTQKLFAATPAVARTLADLAAIPGALPDLRQALPPCRYRARCERAAPDCDRGPIPNVALSPDHTVRCRHPA